METDSLRTIQAWKVFYFQVIHVSQKTAILESRLFYSKRFEEMYAVRDGRGKNEEKVYAGFIFLEQERPVIAGGICLISENLAGQQRGKALECKWSVYTEVVGRMIYLVLTYFRL